MFCGWRTSSADHRERSASLLGKQARKYAPSYTYGDGLLRREGEYPLFDGHGSERTVTNSGQTVTGAVNYEAFGQVAGSTGSSSSPYMYAGAWGYRNDGDAGLMLVGARYYDAQVGRFATRDTVLIPIAPLRSWPRGCGGRVPPGLRPGLTNRAPSGLTESVRWSSACSTGPSTRPYESRPFGAEDVAWGV